MANTYKALSTVTVGAGGAATISFTNIPQTYTDLVLKVSPRNTGSGAGDSTFLVELNGSSSGYTGQSLYSNGSAASSFYETTSEGYGNVVSTWTANTFGNNEIYIPNYTGSNSKVYSIDGTGENNATRSDMSLGILQYNSTSPVTSITVKSYAAFTFAQYSTATLYGVFNADVSSAPATPTIGTASLNGPQGANVTFTGVSNAASYTITPSVGSSSATGTTSPIYISGLTAGSSTTFTVKSNNPFGSSANSAASNAVTPVGGYESIATAVGTGSSDLITFTSIPSGYTHLQIRGVTRNTVSGYAGLQLFVVRFNNDSASNYSWSYMGANGDNSMVTTQNSSNTSDTYMQLGNSNVSNGGLANTLGALIMDIDFYTSNKYKNVRLYSGIDQNAAVGGTNTGTTVCQGNWRSTSTISSIYLYTSGGGGSWTTNTTFALYGIRAAS